MSSTRRRGNQRAGRSKWQQTSPRHVISWWLPDARHHRFPTQPWINAWMSHPAISSHQNILLFPINYHFIAAARLSFWNCRGWWQLSPGQNASWWELKSANPIMCVNNGISRLLNVWWGKVKHDGAVSHRACLQAIRIKYKAAFCSIFHLLSWCMGTLPPCAFSSLTQIACQPCEVILETRMISNN